MVRIAREKYEAPVLKSKDMSDDIEVVHIVRYGTIDLPQTGESDVVWFKEYEKPLNLNKTNMKVLVEQFGDEADAWSGKLVRLVKSMANNPQTGQDTETIRIRPYEKKGKKLDEPTTA